MLVLLVLVCSLVVASLAGHLVHWSLHQRWSGVFNRGHMEHHQVLYPPGRMTTAKYVPARWYYNGLLLFTPPSVFLLASVSCILRLFHVHYWVLAVFAGCMLLLAIANDVTHDSFHVKGHWLARYRWYRLLRKHHYVHHVDMGVNYGIVLFTWDVVFGTKKASG